MMPAVVGLARVVVAATKRTSPSRCHCDKFLCPANQLTC
jgi:hypothetical protein